MEGMKLGKHDAPRKPEIIPFLKSSQQKCQQISDRIYGFVPLLSSIDYLMTRTCMSPNLSNLIIILLIMIKMRTCSSTLKLYRVPTARYP